MFPKRLPLLLLALFTFHLALLTNPSPALAQCPANYDTICCGYQVALCRSTADGTEGPCNVSAPWCTTTPQGSIEIPSYNDIRGAVGLFKYFSPGATPGQVISDLLPWAFALAGILLFLYLIYGGIRILTSLGNPKAVAAGVATVTHAIVGFLLLFCSYWLTRIIEIIFAVNII
jgi:hypothetical protein